MSPWVSTRCAVCDSPESRRLFAIPHPDAPGGRAAVVECTTCGLRRLDPRPDEEDVATYYGSGYYAYQGRQRPVWKQSLWNALRDASSGYASGPLASAVRPLARAVANWRFDVNVPLSGARVLRVVDLGCGYGDLLIYLRSRGCDVQGVDLDVGAARGGAQAGIPIHVGDLDDLALPAASVDVAILQHSLEHMPDPQRVLGELARVVRPGGTLHIALPNGDAVGLELQRESWGCLFCPQHFWYFDRSSLAALVEANGFEVVAVRYKTIWPNHRNLWRAEALARGRVAVARNMIRVLADLARRRDRGDILRLVAKRRPVLAPVHVAATDAEPAVETA